MGVPKSKITRSKRGLRRAHDGIISRQYGECSNCGEFKLSHHVCDACGYYGSGNAGANIHSGKYRDDNWLATGDLFCQDDEGYFYFKG